MSKISFVAECHAEDSVLEAHRNHSRGLGLPEVGSKPVSRALAVVGGGCSVSDSVQELQEFDGEVWAINGAWQWCKDNGIDATFYAIESSPILAEWATGAERAVLADTCHPDTFKALDGAYVELARIGIDDIWHDTTAAGTAPMIAAARGHRHITFFGVESSFGDETHAYRNLRDDYNLVWVECGGDEYTTSPQLIMQAEFMADLARAMTDYMTIPGEGFLQALIEHGDYNVTHVSREIDTALKEANV